MKGFTLVEVLVALTIFALLAAAATGLLAFGIDARAAAAARLGEQAALVRTRALLAGDLGQAAARPWRDAGGARQPAFASGGTLVLGLVRRGWRNDGGAARPSLQRVEWRLAGGRLTRATAPLVDGAATGPATLLLGDVTALRLRLHDGRGWAEGWSAEVPQALPRAAELTIVQGDAPPLRQVFLLPPVVP